MCSMNIGRQVQRHGFVWENAIRRNVFFLPAENNHTGVHDITARENRFNNNENISIKTTGSNQIYMGDILRFFSYDFDERNTLAIIEYRQIEHIKRIRRIYEIDYNHQCHRYLFGDCTYDELNEYVNYIKSIPPGRVDETVKLEYKNRARTLERQHNMKITINAKVDSKTQRRVQCSVSNYVTLLEPYITYISPFEQPNLLRDIEIPMEMEGPPRSHKVLDNEIESLN